MVMDDEKQEIPESSITIKFAFPGSVNMDINFVNVIPLQAAAAAWWLEKQAEVGFFQEQQRKEMQRIQVPEVKPTILKPK
jgi:hypothetical protein